MILRTDRIASRALRRSHDPRDDVPTKAAFKEITKLAADKGIKAKDLAGLVQVVQAQPTEAQKIDVVKRNAEVYYEGEKSRRDAYMTLAGALTKLGNVDFNAARAQAKKEELPVLLTRIEDTLDRLKTWRTDLEPTG